LVGGRGQRGEQRLGSPRRRSRTRRPGLPTAGGRCCVLRLRVLPGRRAPGILFTGIEHVFVSDEFIDSLGEPVLGLGKYGAGKLAKSVVKKAVQVVDKVVEEGKDLVSPPTEALSIS
jgi:hypothetical protein